MSVPTLAPNNQLNIQGIHASNISSTAILTSYPTTTTGSSLGHYAFKNNATNSVIQLNCSGSSTGGHVLAHSSATQTPKNVLTVDRTGVYTDSKFNVSDISNNKAVLIPDNLSISNSSTNNSITLINDVVNPALTLTNTAFQQGKYTTGGVEITNNNNNSQSILQSFQATISQNNNSLTLNSAYLGFNTQGATNAVFIANDANSPIIRINDINTNESILTATDLTFNTVSLPSSVSQNTTDISNNTINIATNTTDISNLKIKDLQIVVSNITLISPAIYADSSIAPQPSPFLSTYGFGGWAYKKASPQASNAKINYYFPFPIINGLVGDLKGLYYQIFNNCLTSDDLPFFTVYTKPTGINDYRSWYHSSMTYVAVVNSSPNQTCQMFANIKSLPFTPQSINIQNQIPLIESTVQNPKGIYADTDSILFIAFGTNSASGLVNAVDFSCSKIGMITNDFSAEYLLI